MSKFKSKSDDSFYAQIPNFNIKANVTVILAGKRCANSGN
jgi:hypothetical protein